MANRYLVASGTWSNASIWSALSGGTGGAGVPGVADNVYIEGNRTVTLDSDVDITYMSVNGSAPGSLRTVNLNGYAITIETIYLAVGTLNIENSSLRFIRRNGSGSGGFLGIDSPNSIVKASNSTIEFDVWSTIKQVFMGRSTNFNDLIINIGTMSGNGNLDITGSPTFRSLIIQSKNSAAHTVSFPDIGSSPLKFEKLVAIGSSTTNRLKLSGGGMGSGFYYNSRSASSYGQFLNISGIAPLYAGSPGDFIARYIGLNSISDTAWGAAGWLTQDPPEISTLVDPLIATPEANPNWYTTGSVTAVTTGHDGGGYRFGSDDAQIDSTGTFDFVDNDLVFQILDTDNEDYGYEWELRVGGLDGSSDVTGVRVVRSYDNYIEAYVVGKGVSSLNMVISNALPMTKFIKLRYSSSDSNIHVYSSPNGTNWTLAGSRSVPSDQALLLKSVRISMTDHNGSGVVLGTVNPQLGPTTPTASFTGTPLSGRAPLAVSFTDTSSGIPTSWLWNFGDGTTSTAQNPTKTYTTVGTYTVQLFASNSLGGSTDTKLGYVTAEATVVALDGIGGAEAFGDVTITPGGITRQLDGIASAEMFGSIQINATVAGVGGIASAEAFGDITVITGRKNVFPDSIVSAEAFGDVGISVGLVTQPLDGVPSSEAFGGLTIVPGPISVGAFDSIASAEAFGTDLAIAQSPPPPPPPIDWSVIGKEDQKSYLYKVYDNEGLFIGIWNDVKDDPQFTQRLYTPGTTMTALLSRSPRTTKEKLDNLVTQGSEQITDEGGDPLLVSYETNNSVGEGTDVELNYQVDVYVIYGGFEPLTTQSGEPITTEDGEEILVSYGAPNGVRIFSGIILDYELVYGEQTGVTVTLASHGVELSEKVLMDGTKTTVTYSSTALETQAKSVLDANPGVMTYSADSISATGVSRTLKYQLNTKLEAIKSIFNQTPDGWYWYGDVGDNYLYMKPKSSVAQHIFWIGYHIKTLKLKRSIEQLRNKVYFVAGDSGGTTIFKKYEDAPSQTAWRTSVYRITDRRYTNTTSMQARADKEMSRFKGPIYTTTVDISSAKYDLERVKLGQMVSVRGSQNAEVDALLLQIVGITYTPTSLKLELGDLLDTQAGTVAELESGLQNEQFEKIPDEPS